MLGVHPIATNMSRSDYFLPEPRPGTLAPLHAAYMALSEQTKKAFTKQLSRNTGMFEYMVDSAGFPGGRIAKNIISRRLNYGKIIDRWICKDEQHLFLRRALDFCLTDENKLGLGLIINPALDDAQNLEKIEKYADEGAERGHETIVVASRWAAAFLNFQGEAFKELCEGAREFGEKVAEALAEGDEDEEEEDQETTFERLRGAAGILADLTIKAQTAAPWDDDAWLGATARAKEAVEGLRKEILSLEPAAEWSNYEELEVVYNRVCAIAEVTKATEESAVFLAGLAAEIRALLPKHKIASRREAQASMRDKSAAEIEGASVTAPASWRFEGPSDPADWLSWIKGLGSDELEKLSGHLRAGQYPATADLAEEIDLGFDLGEVESQSGIRPSEPKSAIIPGRSSKPPELPTETEAPVEQAPEESIPAGGESPHGEPEDLSEPIQEAAREPAQGSLDPASSEIPSEAPVIQKQPVSVAAPVSLPLAAPEVQDQKTGRDFNEIVWGLLENGDRTLAWQYVRSMASEGKSTFPLPPEALEVLALLPIYSERNQDAYLRIREVLSSAMGSGFIEDEHEQNVERRLILTTACMLPSLLDNASAGGAILGELHLGKAGAIHNIVSALKDFSQKGLQISPTVLSATLNVKNWEQQDAEIQHDLHEFMDTARRRSFKNPICGKIWRSWFGNNEGLFTDLFALGFSSKPEDVGAITGKIESLDIDTIIHDEWVSRAPRNAVPNGDGDLAQIQKFAREAVSHLSRRVEHFNSNPNKYNDTRRKYILSLASQIESNYAATITDMEAYVKVEFGEKAVGRALVKIVSEELARLQSFIKGDRYVLACQDTQLWLHGDMYRVQTPLPSGYLDDSGEMTGVFQFGDIDLALSSPLLNWDEAFAAAIDRDDHRAAAGILKRISWDRNPELLESMDKRRGEKLQEARSAIARDLRAAEGELSTALAQGWFSAGEHQNHMDIIQKHTLTLGNENESKNQPYNNWRQDLADIRKSIRAAHDSSIAEVRKQVDEVEATPEDKAKIIAVLQEGDVSLANDYINQIKDDGALHPREDSVATHFFKDFFVEKTGNKTRADIVHERLAKSFNAAEFANEIQAQDSLLGFSLKGIRDRAAISNPIKLWNQIARDNIVNPERVSSIMASFGFPSCKVTPTRAQAACKVVFDTIIPCPVPDFGSNLRGSVDVVCISKTDSVEDVFSTLDKLSLTSAPVILFWVYPLDAAMRRTFAKNCHRRAQKILLVDSVLATLVLLQGRQKLRTLFECALPFTYIAPYSTTAGALPDEIFYGRKKEIRAIESCESNGSSFVFGGRAIGKTVLLKKVAKDFTKNAPHHTSLYLDLNGHSIGTATNADGVWKIIANELHALEPGIFGRSLQGQMRPDTICSKIEEWIKANHERRILLLLDEADSLLAADGEKEAEGRQFNICHRLKGLMDGTDRRFKVVFAGLHNVQRSTRVANNPLAHLGTAICVGPLSNGDAKEAFRLAAEPFAAAGIIYETPNTINSILARTNYYPNLIQLICSRLLKRITDQYSADKHAPPYILKPESLDLVFNLPEVREELRNRFMLTLDLDKRFQLIAHVLASVFKKNPTGLSTERILDDCLLWWKAGFASDQKGSAALEVENFRLLLQEMCGLGILREVSTGKFTLRSPNVAALLGSDVNIENVLCNAENWVTPEPYSPETFRGASRTTQLNCNWRSPMTAIQEAILLENANNVVIISGCNASGIEEVVPRLDEKFGAQCLIKLNPKAEFSHFEKMMDSLKGRQEEKTLLVVPYSSTWTPAWVESAKTRLARFSSNNRVGIVFLADSDTTWRLSDSWKQLMIDYHQTSIALGKWGKGALKTFLSDTGKILLDQPNLEAIAKETGLWHGVLFALTKSMEEPSWHDSNLFNGVFNQTILRDASIESLFGIDKDIQKEVLVPFAGYGTVMTIDDLTTIVLDGKVPASKINKVLDWAASINLLSIRGGVIEFDPFVARMLVAPTIVA